MLTGSLRQGSCFRFPLSYDHRIIDGAEAARFLRRLCEMLENSPESVFEREV